MKQHLTQLGFAICTMMCGLSGPGGSAQAASGAGSAPAPEPLASHDIGSATVKVQLVDDDVLAGQTGKYAGGTMISGFVLNVISQWHLPNGVTALAQGTLSAAQNASGQTTSAVSTLASVSGGGPGSHTNANNAGANPNAQVNGGQSISVNGVSQVTQVAGDRNSGINSALIDFNNNAAMLAGTANAPSAAASNSTGSVKAGISFGSDGIRVALQTPAGLATQTIAPGNGQIAQLLQIAGNSQQAVNALQLHLQTQQMSAAMLRQLGVLQALQNRR
ncbi:peptidase C39 [Paraburkholderia aromaticivorans]|uniref:Peptidase C39 n=1 Tax=Paraburkholderia aromaticivorans TaxID=2026199 RepID=A0A248VI08_9BURK|nr:peptidase C39 [Paraburkholderia aromaticivorans]ASV98502.1 peptidase C39 [Paraburkholderia aromaticivorans]